MTDENRRPDIDPAIVEQIDSVPGLRTALEVIGHAHLKAEQRGRCIIEFSKRPSGELHIYDLTAHFTALERDAGIDEDEEPDDD
jgi:hypothetical protein